MFCLLDYVRVLQLLQQRYLAKRLRKTGVQACMKRFHATGARTHRAWNALISYSEANPLHAMARSAWGSPIETSKATHLQSYDLTGLAVLSFVNHAVGAFTQRAVLLYLLVPLHPCGL